MWIKTPYYIRFVNNIKCESKSFWYCLILYHLNKDNIPYPRNNRCSYKMYEESFMDLPIINGYTANELIEQYGEDPKDIEQLCIDIDIYINICSESKWIFTSSRPERSINLLALKSNNQKHYTLITNLELFERTLNLPYVIYCNMCNCYCKDEAYYKEHIQRCVYGKQPIISLNTEEYRIQKYLNSDKPFTESYIITNEPLQAIKDCSSESNIFIPELSSKQAFEIVQYAINNNLEYSYNKLTAGKINNIKVMNKLIHNLAEMFPYLSAADRTSTNITMIRNELNKSFGIDILNYVSIGSYAYQCLLKTVKQLPTMIEKDKEAFEFMYRAYHGGRNEIYKRYHKGPAFYIDCNSLYPAAGCYKLPVGSYRFIEPPKAKLASNLSKLDASGEYGYYVEIDYTIPDEHKQSLDCYPVTVHNINGEQVHHLIDSNHYVDHILNIQLMIRLGYKITAVHRILKYKQEAILKPFFDKCTKLKTESTNPILIKTYKIIANSVYGMLLKKPRQTKTTICKDQKTYKILTNDKTMVKSIEYLDNNSILIENYTTCRYTNPIQLGITILCISRYIMASYIHETLTPNLTNFQMLYTNTDSIIATADNFKEFLHVHDSISQSCIGKFKIESEDITEFIALQSKVYAYKTTSAAVCKGSSFSFKDYYDCLFKSIKKSQSYLRYRLDKKYIEQQSVNKELLSTNWSGKRELLEDGISTRAIQ